MCVLNTAVKPGESFFYAFFYFIFTIWVDLRMKKILLIALLLSGRTEAQIITTFAGDGITA